MFSFSSDVYPGVELLDYMVVLFLVLWGTSILFSIVAANFPTYSLTNHIQGFPFLHKVFVICGLFNGSDSDRCEVVFHCSGFHFSDGWQCCMSIHVSLWHLCVFSGKMSVYIFCTVFDKILFFWLLNCMSYLYILDFNPLSVISLAIISSPSVDCLFILSVVSFAVQSF